MDKLLAGPLGLIIVLAQAGFLFYLLRAMFIASGEDETMFARFSPGSTKRKAPRARAPHPDAASRGGHGGSRLSSILETFHEPGTGAMSGYVLQGAFTGRRLEDLSRPDCLRLFEYCRIASDDYAMSFLQLYMNYRFGGGFAGARAEERKPERPRPPEREDGAMTREGAYAALGLPPGASDDDIHRAHRALIKKYHPDRGGSHAQAARINQAKDMLLAKAH